MEYQLQLIRQTRENMLNLMEGLSLEALNKVPARFNNNIIWNFGHMLVSQQLLCYRLSGLNTLMEDELILKYRKGTKPEAGVGEAEFEKLKGYAFSLLDRFEKDLKEGLFMEYQVYTTSYNVQLSSIEEAVAFNSLHESLHLGYAMAQRKLLL